MLVIEAGDDLDARFAGTALLLMEHTCFLKHSFKLR
jgi:hypothetical protein